MWSKQEQESEEKVVEPEKPKVVVKIEENKEDEELKKEIEKVKEVAKTPQKPPKSFPTVKTENIERDEEVDLGLDLNYRV